MELIAIIIAVLFWWAPAAIYYLAGLYWLLTAPRQPHLAIIWTLSFIAMFSYTLYESVYLKSQVEERAQTFRELVAFAPPPADVTTLVVYRDGSYSNLTGNGQECATVCVKTLLDGRFKEFIIGFKEPALFRDLGVPPDSARPPDRDPLS